MIDSQRRCAVRLPAFASKRELWRLQDLAASLGLTVSELIRQCLEDRYGQTFEGEKPGVTMARYSKAHPTRDEPITYTVGEP